MIAMADTGTTVALSLLRANLGFYNVALDEDVTTYLQHLLTVATDELTTICKLTLDPNDVWDADLCAMYAAWLYRKRVTGEGKPPMLKASIRNRQLHTATAGEGGA